MGINRRDETAVACVTGTAGTCRGRGKDCGMEIREPAQDTLSAPSALGPAMEGASTMCTRTPSAAPSLQTLPCGTVSDGQFPGNRLERRPGRGVCPDGRLCVTAGGAVESRTTR